LDRAIPWKPTAIYFLQAFARPVLSAEPEDFIVLWPALCAFPTKYHQFILPKDPIHFL
jgi:hypothetical protein